MLWCVRQGKARPCGRARMLQQRSTRILVLGHVVSRASLQGVLCHKRDEEHMIYMRHATGEMRST